jgi:hypothetical protein
MAMMRERYRRSSITGEVLSDAIEEYAMLGSAVWPVPAADSRSSDSPLLRVIMRIAAFLLPAGVGFAVLMRQIMAR